VLFPPGTPKAAVKPPDWMAKKDREAVDWYEREVDWYRGGDIVERHKAV